MGRSREGGPAMRPLPAHRRPAPDRSAARQPSQARGVDVLELQIPLQLLALRPSRPRHPRHTADAGRQAGALHHRQHDRRARPAHVSCRREAFYRRVGGGRLVAMLDGPRTPTELDLVARHFHGVIFKQIADVPVGARRHRPSTCSSIRRCLTSLNASSTYSGMPQARSSRSTAHAR